MSIILGLDCSSTTIGYAALNWNEKNNKIKVVDYGFYKPIKEGNILDRLRKTQNDFKDLINTIKPDYIAIEDIILFMKGHSTANTITTLTAFNRALGLVAYEYLGRSPDLYSVMKIRHTIKLNKELPKKEEIPQVLEKRLNFKYEYLYKKNGTIKAETYDQSDALAVALCHALTLSNSKITKKSK